MLNFNIKKFVILSLLFLGLMFAPCAAQEIAGYHNLILDINTGVGIPATITVYDAGTTDLVTLYYANGDPMSNPLATDNKGRFSFFIVAGSYDIKVTGSGITPYTLEDVSIVGSPHAETHEVGGSDLVGHDDLTGFVANEHFLQSAITVDANELTNTAGSLGLADHNTARTALGLAIGTDIPILAHTMASHSDDDTYNIDTSGTAAIGALTLSGDLYTDRWLEHNSNTFVGVNAAGGGNLAHSAGDEGWYNTAMGHYVLYTNTTGYQGAAVGAFALYANTTGNHNTAMGGSALRLNTAGGSNTAVGYYALYGNVAGGQNAAVGRGAGRFQNDGTSELQTPENSVYLGAGTKSGSDPDGGEDAIVNEIVIGYNAIGNGPDTVTLGNTSITELHCQVALTVDSDQRIKRDIAPSDVGLDFINSLNPITFKQLNPFDYPEQIRPPEYKDRTIVEIDDEGKETTRIEKAKERPLDNENVYFGLIAQEIEAVLAERNITSDIVATAGTGKKGIRYTDLIMPLITAVQELSAEVKALKAELAQIRR